MLLEKENTQLERYTENLPTKPYCTDWFDFGLLIRSKNTALKHRHIQHNKHTSVAYIVLDVDHPFSLQMLSEQLLPQPNFLVINPENYHAHIFYELSTPVYTTNFARQKPLRYLASIEYALREQWQADKGYSGLISKNPLHSDWKLVQLRQEPWELGELADWLTLPKKLPRQRKDESERAGLGRNVALFDMLRFWAYDNVLSYRISGGGFWEWYEAVEDTADSFNCFHDPLAFNEVKSIVKSVAEWVWTNYTKEYSDEKFSEIQAHRGRLGGLKGGRGRTEADKEKRLQACEMRKAGHTQQQIADALQVSLSTIKRWLKRS